LICSGLGLPALGSASRGLWGSKRSTRDHTRIAIATAATNNARIVVALSPLATPSTFGLSDIDRRPYFGGCSSTKAALTSRAAIHQSGALPPRPTATGHRLAIEALKLPAADILAQQELHRPAALRADRRRRIFRHDAHAGPGGSATLSVTDNCRD
jgi:hypothetical protein